MQSILLDVRLSNQLDRPKKWEFEIVREDFSNDIKRIVAMEIV